MCYFWKVVNWIGGEPSQAASCWYGTRGRMSSTAARPKSKGAEKPAPLYGLQAFRPLCFSASRQYWTFGPGSRINNWWPGMAPIPPGGQFWPQYFCKIFFPFFLKKVKNVYLKMCYFWKVVNWIGGEPSQAASCWYGTRGRMSSTAARPKSKGAEKPAPHQIPTAKKNLFHWIVTSRWIIVGTIWDINNFTCFLWLDIKLKELTVWALTARLFMCWIHLHCVTSLIFVQIFDGFFCLYLQFHVLISLMFISVIYWCVNSSE